MNRLLYIIALLSATMLLTEGCAHKKRIKPTTKPLSEQEEAAIEAERLRDSIALAQAIAEAQAREQQRINDSIARAEEEARKAMFKTLNVPRMTVTVQVQGKQISTPATMRWQRGTGVIVSVQPFAGIEMFRAEYDGKAMTIIDKINRRYTRLMNSELEQRGIRVTMDEADAWMDEHILAHRDEPQLTLQVARGGINGSAVIYTASMQINGRVNIKPTNIEMYRQVSLEQLVKGL